MGRGWRAVVGHIKTVIVLAGGCILFKEEMPLQRLLGIILAMSGIGWYSAMKLQVSNLDSSCSDIRGRIFGGRDNRPSFVFRRHGYGQSPDHSLLGRTQAASAEVKEKSSAERESLLRAKEDEVAEVVIEKSRPRPAAPVLDALKE